MNLKDTFKPITNALEKSSFFVNFPLSPNILTLFSILLALTGAYYIYINQLLLALVFIMLSLLMDGVDGIVARAKKIENSFGAFLDGLTDRIVEFIIIVPLIFYAWPHQVYTQLMLLLILFFGSFLTSFIVAYSVHRGVVKNKDTKHMKVIFQRAERTIFLMVFVVFTAYMIDYVFILASIGAILSFISFMQRFVFVYKYSKGVMP